VNFVFVAVAVVVADDIAVGVVPFDCPATFQSWP
jgi:hypothetical protein